MVRLLIVLTAMRIEEGLEIGDTGLIGPTTITTTALGTIWPVERIVTVDPLAVDLPIEMLALTTTVIARLVIEMMTTTIPLALGTDHPIMRILAIAVMRAPHLRTMNPFPPPPHIILITTLIVQKKKPITMTIPVQQKMP